MGQQWPQEKQRTRLLARFSTKEGSASRTLWSRMSRRVGTGGLWDHFSAGQGFWVGLQASGFGRRAFGVPIILRAAISSVQRRGRGGRGSTWLADPTSPSPTQRRPILLDRGELPDRRLEREHGLQEVRGAILQPSRRPAI